MHCFACDAGEDPRRVDHVGAEFKFDDPVRARFDAKSGECSGGRFELWRGIPFNFDEAGGFVYCGLKGLAGLYLRILLFSWLEDDFMKY